MAEIRAKAERDIAAPPERVYQYIADYRQHHPNWLPPAFSGLTVEEGNVGQGTVVRYRLRAGNREREYRMRIAEPEPGSVLTESDAGSSLITTWTVRPVGTGSHVTLESSWQGAGGIGGFFERTFAPRALSNVYDSTIGQLDQYARQASSP